MPCNLCQRAWGKVFELRPRQRKKELKVKNSDDDDTPNPPSVNSKERTIKESVNLTAISGWTHTFTNLDKKANGVDINYTVVENNVPTAAIVTNEIIDEV